MNELVTAIARSRGGFGFRSDFIAEGFRDKDIKAARRSGVITRLRHGVYAPKVDVDQLSPEEKHVLTARAVIARLGSGYVLSHYSAAIMHEPVSYDVDLDTVHVTRLGGRQSRTESGVAFHSIDIDESEIVEMQGVPVVSAARAGFEAASISTTESGLVIINAALNAGLYTQEEIAAVGQQGTRWPNTRHARLAIRLSEPRCESPGESRSLYMFYTEGVPRPQFQVVLAIGDGEPDPRVDCRWEEHCHAGEFDGLYKYGRLNTGADPYDVLVSEKHREDRIRAIPCGMSRWTWRDLDPKRRSATASRINAALAQSRRLYRRNAVHIPLGPTP